MTTLYTLILIVTVISASDGGRGTVAIHEIPGAFSREKCAAAAAELERKGSYFAWQNPESKINAWGGKVTAKAICIHRAG